MSNQSSHFEAVSNTANKLERKHPLQAYAETSGLPESSVEPTSSQIRELIVKNGRIESEKIPKSKPEKSVKPAKTKTEKNISQPRGIWPIIFEILGDKPMELEQLVKEIEKKGSWSNPRWVPLHEFDAKEENGKVMVYPRLGEKGAAIIAKVGAKGRGHFWLRKEPKKILEVGRKILNKTELAKLEKVLADQKA